MEVRLVARVADVDGVDGVDGVSGAVCSVWCCRAVRVRSACGLVDYSRLFPVTGFPAWASRMARSTSCLDSDEMGNFTLTKRSNDTAYSYIRAGPKETGIMDMITGTNTPNGVNEEMAATKSGVILLLSAVTNV